MVRHPPFRECSSDVKSNGHLLGLVICQEGQRRSDIATYQRLIRLNYHVSSARRAATEGTSVQLVVAEPSDLTGLICVAGHAGRRQF